jgi:Flp pilus assembly protein TadD
VAAPAAPAPAPAAPAARAPAPVAPVPVPAKPVPVEVDPEQQFRELMTRGLAAADRGAYGDAARSFRQAVKLNPRDPDAWNSLGVVLARQGNVSGGADALRQSLAVDGTFAPAHRNLGIVLERQGRNREAIPHYRAFLFLVADNDPDRDAVRARLSVPIRQVPRP